MIPHRILLDVALLEAATLLITWTAIVLSGVRAARKRAREPRMAAARDALVRGLLAGSLEGRDRKVVETLSRSARIELFEGLVSNLRGREREWLGRLAGELGLVAYGRRLSRSRFWWRRLRGARILTLVGRAGDDVLALADDPDSVVRGQVAEWCGDNPSELGIGTLIRMLGDPAQASRFAVQDALVRIGSEAVDALAEALGRFEDETEILAGLHVARGIGDSHLAPAVLRFTGHSSASVREAAFRTLGATGGTGAAERLEQGLGDPDPDVRAAAAASLGELGHWPSGPRLVRALEDPAWDVRYSAGRALVRLGPPGELLLRRVLDAGDNAFAADMARHAMDTAAVVTRFGGA